jgi:hypothetical protein
MFTTEEAARYERRIAMTQHRLQSQARSRQAADVPPAWTGWVRQHWEAVRVVQVEVTSQFADATDRVRVRAVIHLGALSPADVRVDVVGDVAEPVDASVPRLGELCSAQSYHNGTFVFEGIAATNEFGDHPSLTVRVRPRSADGDLSGLTAVATSSRGPRDAG